MKLSCTYACALFCMYIILQKKGFFFKKEKIVLITDGSTRLLKKTSIPFDSVKMN